MKIKVSRFPALSLAVAAMLAILNAQLSTCHAQNMVFTYQGRVTDNGTNFTGAGQFKFALVTSTNNSHQATAIANLSGSFVTSYNLTYGGNGYATAPAVHINGGGGSGATATAVISGGVVTAINPGSAGAGYTSAPAVTLDAPPANILYTTYWSNDGTSSAGSQPMTAVTVPVANGLFTVVLGDTTLANMTALSAALFTQPDLQLLLWFNDGVNGFNVLTPVQSLTPTPYAAFATTASNVSGTVSAAQISGPVASANLSGTYASAVVLNNAANSFTGNGIGLTSVNAATLNGLSSTSFWKMNGNAGANPTNGAFLGTADNLPLELKVNNQRALRLEPNVTSPNVIGGYSGNVVSNGFYGAVIGGGGSSGYPNRVGANYATVVGGQGNIASGLDSTAMGFYTRASGNYSTAMGYFTTASGSSSTAMGSGTLATGGGSIATGYNSAAIGEFSTAMGSGTTASGSSSTAMGAFSTASNSYTMAAGYRAKALYQGDFVWADSQESDFSSTANNQFLIRAQGGVGIGTTTPQAALDVAGGARVSGLLRSGSETGTSDTPNPAGMVVRRVNSINSTAGLIVAMARTAGNTASITLERDGSSGGFLIRYPATPGYLTIACMGMDSTGTQRNFYTTTNNPGTAGTVQIYANAQNIVHFECTFGITYNVGQHLTQVTLSRYGTDYFWSGTMMSTYNQ